MVVHDEARERADRPPFLAGLKPRSVEANIGRLSQMAGQPHAALPGSCHSPTIMSYPDYQVRRCDSEQTL